MSNKSAEYDDFFDSPRHHNEKHDRRHHDEALTPSNGSDISHDSDFRPTNAKPPAHPHSRPTSAASLRSAGRLTSPKNTYSSNDDERPRSRRVIEAKVPTVMTEPDENEETIYDDDSFSEQESSESDSGRQTPALRSVNYKTEQGAGDGYNPPKCRRHAVECQLPKQSQCEPLELSDDSESCSNEDMSDSDDLSEVTSVSPLSTPHVTSNSSSNYNSINTMLSPSDSDGRRKRSGTRDTATNQNRGLLLADSDAVDLSKLLETVLEMESDQRRRSGTPTRPTSSNSRPAIPSFNVRRRSNYSFSDDQVRAIERENQRLMKSIMRHAAEAQKTKTRGVKPFVAPPHIAKRPTSAAINREKERQKIAAENMMLLRKLQQTRPSHELRRDVLVGDFERMAVGNSSGAARPLSAQSRGSPSPGSRPSSSKHRPISSHVGSGRNTRASRPASAYPSRPDDDDILTWQPSNPCMQ